MLPTFLLSRAALGKHGRSILTTLLVGTTQQQQTSLHCRCLPVSPSFSSLNVQDAAAANCFAADDVGTSGRGDSTPPVRAALKYCLEWSQWASWVNPVRSRGFASKAGQGAPLAPRLSSSAGGKATAGVAASSDKSANPGKPLAHDSRLHSGPARLVLQPRGAVPAQYAPWTPTRLLVKRNANPRRMRFLMDTLDLEAVAAARAARPLPKFGAGDVLEVTMVVPEAQRKEVTYRGVCIGVYNRGIATAFKLYNVFQDSGGIVQHIPLYMPDLLNIRVVRSIPVRRNKLYYMMEDQTTKMNFGDITIKK